MNPSTANSGSEYRPAPESLPPFLVWPIRFKDCLNWFWRDLIFPYGLFFFALAVLSWHFLTPDRAQMETLQPGWMLLIWLRNAMLLMLVAGGLHWWLYIKRRQQQQFKLDARWQNANNSQFLFNNQVHDNMFWSLGSGCFFWSLYESLTLWWYASGGIQTVAWGDSPLYLLAMVAVLSLWGSLHFYLIHRLLHWPPLYRVAHALHHRNVNIGPWSGIAMHPLEHALYFSSAMLWWVLPVEPIIVIAAGFFTGLGPAFSHCGFEQVKIGRKLTFPAGAPHHQLHHRYFTVNYGNPRAPMDHLFGSWHDGSDAAHARFMRNKGA